MGILESVKNAAEQATGIAPPRKQELVELVKVKKPLEFRFKDDGLVPNHPFWPFVVLWRGEADGAIRLRGRAGRAFRGQWLA